MKTFLYPRGVVYVLENVTVGRVKVGMTGIGVNNVEERLRDVNDMWSERKVSCQVCGGRLVNVGGFVPNHVVSGRRCEGGASLPIEQSVTLAETYLDDLRTQVQSLSGSVKSATRRKINTLERKIERYRDYVQPRGTWVFRIAYHTDGVAEVEAAAHKVLEEYADKLAPFGEVFVCSAERAIEAIEVALEELDVEKSVRVRRQI